MPWYTAAPPGDEPPSAHLGHVCQGRIQTRCRLSFARDEARRVDGGPRDQPDDACRWCLAGQAHPLPEQSRPRHRLHRRPRRRAATLAGVLTTVTIVAVVAGVAAVVLAVIGVVALWVLG